MRPACFRAAMRTKRHCRAFQALSLCLLAVSVPLSAEKLRSHFDSDAMLREPGFFDFAVLVAPGDARWKVVGEDNPPSAPHHVSQIVQTRPPASIAVALRRNLAFRDGTSAVALKKGPGRGGIVFRFGGEKDFLVCLLDLSTGEARLSSYRSGRVTELARGGAKLANPWGVLSVRTEGPKVEVTWDGARLLEASDPNPVAGRSGMATAGPGLVAFDELMLEAADEAVGGKR